MSAGTDLTALLRKHWMSRQPIWGTVECSCGHSYGTDRGPERSMQSHAAHVASVVSAAYTLTPKEPESPPFDLELERLRLKVMHAQEQRDREYRHPETDWQHQWPVDRALAEAQDELAKYNQSREAQ